MNIFSLLLTAFAPKKCIGCGKYGYNICPDCLEKLESYPSICHVTKRYSRRFEVLKKTPECSLDALMVAYYYREQLIEKAIKNAKFYGQYPILHDFAPRLGTLLLENISQKREDIILVSVPMYFWKKLKRGYNQSEVLATHIAKHTGLTYMPIIKKIRSHVPQSHLKKTDRLKNVSHSFLIKKKYLSQLSGKTIVLVDDVVSTGATLSEIAKLLRQAGARRVCGLCIASN